MSSTPITSFTGEYRFLSNFYPAKVTILDYPYVFPTVEHAYQAAKTVDWAERELFTKPNILMNGKSTPLTASVAKRLGRQITMRHDWDKVKLIVMGNLIDQKFNDPILKQQLLDTGSVELIEGNWWGDTYWGVCNEVGHNFLGKLLMTKRALIRSEAYYE